MRRVAKTPMLTAIPMLPIYDAVSARRIAELPYFRRRARARIVIALRNIPEPEQRRVEVRLNKLYNACGCAASTMALTLTLLILVVLWAWMDRDWGTAWVMLPGALLASIIAMVIGKFLGLLWARRALKSELLRIAAMEASN